jgi:Protein kinase domain
MDNSRRGTFFPTSADKGKPLQDTGRCRSPERQPAKLKRHADGTTLPPRLPFPVNPYSNHWDSSRPVKRQSTNFCVDGSPWREYFPILPEEQAGPVTVAHKICKDFTVHAIKERRLDTLNQPSALFKITHPQLVHLRAAYTKHPLLYLVYESMEVSLEDIESCPHGPLKEFEIATICREVILGLQYIHTELHISYGKLSSENILLTRDGHVKIGKLSHHRAVIAVTNSPTLANIAEALMLARTDFKADTQSLGPFTMELMEPGKAIRMADTLVPEASNLWGDEIRDFLRQTQNVSMANLKHVRFHFHFPLNLS